MDSCGCPPKAGSSACENDPISENSPCPTNRQAGKVVDTLTLKALLDVPLSQLRPIAYHFCRASDCPTVYYSDDGEQVFSEADLRERVYQKHPAEPDITVCYCFRHTVGSIREEIARTGQSSVIQEITNAIQAGSCACDIRNPQGSCCLGNVNSLVKQLKKEIGQSGEGL